MQQLELKVPESAPSFKNSKSLFLFSDYSGEHKEANYTTYSFLLADETSVSSFDADRLSVRAKFLPDNRTFSFKKLNDKYRSNALEDFTRASDRINGILFSFAINKKAFLFEETIPDNNLGKQISNLKPNVVNKMITASHLGAYLVSSLAFPDQNIMWFTDNDSISANDKTTTILTQVFATSISNIVDFNLGNLRCGSAKCDMGNNQIEDLLAIPDFAAGMISEQLAKHQYTQNMFCISSPTMSPKMLKLAWWYSDSSTNLKKFLTVLDTRNGKTTQSFYHFFN